jgi:hypothetical protein
VDNTVKRSSGFLKIFLFNVNVFETYHSKKCFSNFRKKYLNFWVVYKMVNMSENIQQFRITILPDIELKYFR